eukprot:NODE_406_length_9252_cov_0.363269.p1 type:complete len:811 gc:universal NODE_406_length_9252_cov_0.363269:3218-5650(+)
MIVFTSEHAQLSLIQDINAPVCNSIEILESTILISADDGIYYGLYSNLKKLTLNKNTTCLLKSGGDLMTIHPSYIASSSQKIECDFQPTRLLPMRHYCLFYNPNGYFSHLIRNELKSHLLPCTILKKPINCAGFINHKSDIRTLLVTGHTIYQFKNGNNTPISQNTFDFGIFCIIDGYSTWMCISIIDHSYCLVELDPETLQLLNTVPLDLSDKCVFINAYIHHNSLIVVCASSVLVYNMHGQLLESIVLPNNARVAATSPLIDKDGKLRFVSSISTNKKYTQLELYALDINVKHSIPSDQYTNVINYYCFGWLNTPLSILPGSVLDVFIDYLVSSGSIQSHIEALHRFCMAYKSLDTPVPVKCLELLIFKQLGLFMSSIDDHLYLSSCNMSNNRHKSLFNHKVVEFDFLFGAAQYLNGSQDQQLTGLDMAMRMLNIIIDDLVNFTVGHNNKIPSICTNSNTLNCVASGLQCPNVTVEYIESAGVYLLLMLQHPNDLDVNNQLVACFGNVTSLTIEDDLGLLAKMLKHYPNSACISNAIFCNSAVHYDLVELLCPQLNEHVLQSFINNKKGELLCHFKQGLDLGLHAARYPEIQCLLNAKVGNLHKANDLLLLGITKYEQEHGIEFGKLHYTKSKSMGFSLSKCFDYPYLLSLSKLLSRGGNAECWSGTRYMGYYLMLDIMRMNENVFDYYKDTYWWYKANFEDEFNDVGAVDVIICSLLNRDTISRGMEYLKALESLEYADISKGLVILGYTRAIAMEVDVAEEGFVMDLLSSSTFQDLHCLQGYLSSKTFWAAVEKEYRYACTLMVNK